LPSTVSFVHEFGDAFIDGTQPEGPLIRATDGNLYGVTRNGGHQRCSALSLNDSGCGVVFRVAADGAFTIVHRFTGTTGDGGVPAGPLIQGRDGALYGVTLFGGVHGRGALYRVTLDGVASILHSFGPTNRDPSNARGRLLQAPDGSFWGATAGGENCPAGSSECGTIFRLTEAGAFKVVHSFGPSQAQGHSPTGNLTIGADGGIYGVTAGGGDANCRPFHFQGSGCGIIFRISAEGTLTVVHVFTGGAEGIRPVGPLIRGPDGAMYGTTYGGGGGACGGVVPGCGTVYRLSTAGAFSTLHAFSSRRGDSTIFQTDGHAPTGFLALGRDGIFYGTTEAGGRGSTEVTGTVFRLTPDGVVTTIHRFGELLISPTGPVGGLVELQTGAFFGVTDMRGTTTAAGGVRPDGGTVFRIDLR
jgi:uncharacterized repeat protein (TIGR03803 family)